jgi:uncharacterized protein YkwD
MRLISTIDPDSPMPLAGAVVDRRVQAYFDGPIDHTQTDERIRKAINYERAKWWLPVLESHPALAQAAQAQADHCAARDTLDHFSAWPFTKWAERCARAGYPGASLMTIGENVAGWQVSAEQAVKDWMSSPGHRQSILGTWQHCGSASATAASGRSYWVVDFGRLA